MNNGVLTKEKQGNCVKFALMKKRKSYYPFLLIFLLTVFSAILAKGQNLSGQWRGGFISTGGILDDQTEYVLELEINGTTVSGYSYTYFIIMGKRCYVICKLKGSYDKASKYVVVTEFEKVKSNTPPEFRDCFQTHMLTFFKQGETEVLKGNWKPATLRDNCGIGETQLERKVLVKATPPKPEKKTSIAQNKTTPKTTPGTTRSSAPVTKNKTTPKTTPGATRSSAPVTKNKTTPKTTTGTTKAKQPVTKKSDANKTTNDKNQDVAKNKKQTKPETIDQNLPKIEKPKAPPTINSSVVKGVEKRSKQIIKTILVDTTTFRVDLYDNGQIDGDTVSLYFNGKLMISKERLSAKPITLKIKINPEISDNDLVMYAENLGSIPPNTSLMVVHVGDKRYEVNITSTDQTSGTIRFKYKE
jgi:hypothetical protein